jgi:hypothetical protein
VLGVRRNRRLRLRRRVCRCRCRKLLSRRHRYGMSSHCTRTRRLVGHGSRTVQKLSYDRRLPIVSVDGTMPHSQVMEAVHLVRCFHSSGNESGLDDVGRCH